MFSSAVRILGVSADDFNSNYRAKLAFARALEALIEGAKIENVIGVEMSTVRLLSLLSLLSVVRKITTSEAIDVLFDVVLDRNSGSGSNGGGPSEDDGELRAGQQLQERLKERR